MRFKILSSWYELCHEREEATKGHDGGGSSGSNCGGSNGSGSSGKLLLLILLMVSCCHRDVDILSRLLQIIF